MKAILVILMILAHCIQLIFNNSNSPNIISFLLLKIALFDILVENDDRKPTNNNIIVQVVDKKYYFNAIDHAYVFNSLNYENLNPSYGVTNTYN